jgi:hypothetical protein
MDGKYNLSRHYDSMIFLVLFLFFVFSSIASGYKSVEKITAMNADVLYQNYAILCCM